MNTTFDTILFDLDGTLTDPMEGITRSIQHAIARMGQVPPQTTDLYCFIGPPLKGMFMGVMGMDDATADRAVALYREYYQVHGWHENRLYSGIEAMLAALKGAGKRIVLATNKPQPFAEKIMQHFDIDGSFDFIIGSELDGTRGNKTEVIAEALSRTGGSAVMVGDTKYDIEGATNNGIPCIGVSYGYGPPEQLAGSIAVVDSPEQLTQLLLDSPSAQPQKGKRGRFISFEGMDGAGKSMQITMLAEWLSAQGEKVYITREPGGNPVSEAVREIVLSPAFSDVDPVCEALLFAGARAQHVSQDILPALERGETVLCDRFVHSSLAYQGAGRELGIENVLQINRPAIRGLWPDTVLILDMDPEQALSRRSAADELDRLEQEQADFRKRVREGFLHLAKKDPERVHLIDATGTAEQVHQAIVRAVQRG